MSDLVDRYISDILENNTQDDSIRALWRIDQIGTYERRLEERIQDRVISACIPCYRHTEDGWSVVRILI